MLLATTDPIEIVGGILIALHFLGPIAFALATAMARGGRRR